MRKWILSAAAALALAVTLVVLVWQTPGQPPGGKTSKDAGLPIRQVVLFNSGVSYFEREGDVDGNARIDLSFPTSDINDLLKSLVLQDTAGKVSTVNYDSHDPVEKVLHSFALNLNNNPTYSQILNQARGEKIEITHKPADGKTVNPAAVNPMMKQTGVIVGVEVRKRPAGKDAVVDMDFLNFTSEAGLQSIALDQVQSIRFLNPVIDSEFQKALRVVASSHDTQKKTVSLGFTGAGKRKVKVGYVIEQPIWKSSYRLQIKADDKIDIQGWAIVENTTDDDWNDVRMVLVSGRPISFKMDLYEPLYIPRPTVEPELFASLRPQVYGGALNKGDKLEMGLKDSKLPLGAEKLDQAMDALKEAKEGSPRERPSAKKKIQDALAEQGKAVEKLEKAIEKVPALDFKQGIDSIANASELGEYYQYVIDQKITLPRQKSAMLPVLNQEIEGSKVSIYNESTHAKYPLLGLRLKNSSKQPLNQGPITVYEDGSYAGDTRILDLQAKEERLLSYALDQAVEIKSEVKSEPGPDMNFKIDSSTLTANYKMRETRTYTIRNRALKPRTVLLEHPIRGTWKLIDSLKPLETTRDMYRFQVKVPAESTASFDVIEDQDRSDHLTLPSGQPQYVAGTGINVKTLTHADEEKLLGVKISKGYLTPTLKERISRTYFVQNLSTSDRTFTVDHIVADGWSRIDDMGDAHRGPEIFRFLLKVPHDKTGERKVVEERVYQAKAGLVKDFSDDKLHSYLASPVLGADVRTGLTKVLAMRAKIAESRKSLDELEGQFKVQSADQARLRENLKILQGSDQHKKFLEKFVALDNEIESLQKQIRQLQTTLQGRERDYETFVAALTAV